MQRSDNCTIFAQRQVTLMQKSTVLLSHCWLRQKAQGRLDGWSSSSLWWFSSALWLSCFISIQLIAKYVSLASWWQWRYSRTHWARNSQDNINVYTFLQMILYIYIYISATLNRFKPANDEEYEQFVSFFISKSLFTLVIHLAISACGFLADYEWYFALDNPFIPMSDQFQISPEASPEI